MDHIRAPTRLFMLLMCFGSSRQTEHSSFEPRSDSLGDHVGTQGPALWAGCVEGLLTMATM